MGFIMGFSQREDCEVCVVPYREEKSVGGAEDHFTPELAPTHFVERIGASSLSGAFPGERAFGRRDNGPVAPSCVGIVDARPAAKAMATSSDRSHLRRSTPHILH